MRAPRRSPHRHSACSTAHRATPLAAAGCPARQHTAAAARRRARGHPRAAEPQVQSPHPPSPGQPFFCPETAGAASNAQQFGRSVPSPWYRTGLLRRGGFKPTRYGLREGRDEMQECCGGRSVAQLRACCRRAQRSARGRCEAIPSSHPSPSGILAMCPIAAPLHWV